MFFEEKNEDFFWNEKRLRSGILSLQRQTDKWLRSSVGQSTRLLIWGFWVQVPAESPVNSHELCSGNYIYDGWSGGVRP